MSNHQIVRFDTQALNRALLGYDTFFEDFEARFANQLNSNYPPFNVLKRGENLYEIHIAVTGFDPDEISVVVDQNTLIVRGESIEEEDIGLNWLHRGLASRDFTRSFALAEHMEVGDGTIKNGVLTIALNRVVPEYLKPRNIKIKAE
jgi:molecular chaperone IbpA